MDSWLKIKVYQHQKTLKLIYIEGAANMTTTKTEFPSFLWVFFYSYMEYAMFLNQVFAGIWGYECFENLNK